MKNSQGSILSFLCFLLRSAIFLTCFSTVCYYVVSFIQDYLENPEAVSLSFGYIGDQPAFPAITICLGTEACPPDGDLQAYNETILRQCGFPETYKGRKGCGRTADNYRYKGIWTTPKCNDPEKLFESLMPKFEDLIYNITIAFHTNKTRVVVTPENTHGIISTTDRKTYARCYIVIPSHEMLRDGIKWMKVYGKVKLQFFILTPGMLESSRVWNLRTLRPGQFLDINVDHEVYEMLEYRGVRCNPDFAFRKDTCENEALNNITLTKYGCTSPWGPDKTKICKTNAENTTLNSILNQEWKNIFSQIGGKKQCPYPCNLINVKTITKTDCSVCIPDKPCNPCTSTFQSSKADERYGYLRLWFQENIKFMKSSYLKSGYSLISDMGGCIGIFLGWSILQINEYINERYIRFLGISKISNVIDPFPDAVMTLSKN